MSAAGEPPRVLVLIEWYLPGQKAGGPVRTVSALVHHLSGRVRFAVATRDRDLGDKVPYPDVAADVWLEGHPEHRRYLRPRDQWPLAFLRLCRRTPHDVLYLNSLFSGTFALYPLIFKRLGLLRPGRLVLAPSGQLDPGALAIRTRKKLTYLTVIRGLGLLRDVEWHASSPDERGHIRRLVPSATVHVAPNMRRPSTIPAGTPSPTGGVRAVFLSRISEKKNLDGALRMLSDCRCPVEFDIYGPQEDAAYWRRCRRTIASLPKHVTCRYHGVVPHDGVPRVFADHDLLLLPTKGENFGHVIGEALEAGCLALVSNRTPWRGLAARGAGWDLPLDKPAAFTAALEEYARLDEAQRTLRRRRAREFARLRDSDENLLTANLQLLAGTAAEREAAAPVSAGRLAPRGRTPTC